jgi:hypothetical protein
MSRARVYAVWHPEHYEAYEDVTPVSITAGITRAEIECT